MLYCSAVFYTAEFIWRRVNPWLRFCATVIFLFSPVKLFIDHVNQQINYLPMSFFLLSLRAALSSHFALSAALGALCVLSKHTYVILFLPFVVFTLSRLSRLPSKSAILLKLIKISLSALLTASIVLLPFILSGSLSSLIRRLMPEDRIFQYLSPSIWLVLNSFIQIRYL